MLRLSHPGIGTGSLISKMGNSTLERHAYSVHARTWEEMQGLLYETCTRCSHSRSVDVVFSLSGLRESSFWLNASSSGSSLLQWRHSSSRQPSDQSHARAPFLPLSLPFARALSLVYWVRARQSVAYRFQSSYSNLT